MKTTATMLTILHHEESGAAFVKSSADLDPVRARCQAGTATLADALLIAAWDAMHAMLAKLQSLEPMLAVHTADASKTQH